MNVDLTDIPNAKKGIDLSDIPNRKTVFEDEPISFDLEGTLDEFNKAMPVNSDDPKGDLAKCVYPFVKPFASVGYNSAAALNRGMASFSEHLNTISEYIGDSSGTEKGGFFLKAAESYEQNASYWQDRIDKVGSSFLEELLGEAIGGAVPGVGEFLLNIPYYGLYGAAEAHKKGDNELVGALTEAGKRGVLGLLFKAIHPLKQYLRAPTMGGIFGIQAAAEGGDTKEIAKGFGTGMLYSASSPGGRMGLNEIRAGLNRRVADIESKMPQDGLEQEKTGEGAGEGEKAQPAAEGGTEQGVRKTGPQNLLTDIISEGKIKFGKDYSSYGMGKGNELLQETGKAREWVTPGREDLLNKKIEADRVAWLEKHVDVLETILQKKDVVEHPREAQGAMFTNILGKEVGNLAKEAESGDTAAFAPEKGFRRTAESATETDKIYRRSDIVRLLREKLDIPIRTGRFKDRALGIFKVQPEIVRSGKANDIEVIAHEIGHALNKYMWGMKRKNLETAQFAPYADELLPIATQPKAGQPPLQEGFSEFIRLYITNATRARNVAPRFYDYFEKTINEKLPEVQEVFLEARNQYDKWLKQPALYRVLSQLSVGKTEDRPTTIKDLYTMAVDDLFPLRDIVQEMANKKELPADQDPYKQARLLRGWHGKADAFLRHSPFKFKTYENVGKPLQEILKPIEGDLDEFRAFVTSKRTIELSKRGIETGISKADAVKIVTEFEGKFNQTFEDLKEYQDLSLQYLRDSGVLGKDGYKAIKQLNDDYVPLYRIMDDARLGSGAGKGLQARNPVRKIKGSWRDIQDPLESIVKNTYLYINLAEKNAVGTALVGLAKSKDGMGKYVEKIPAPMQKVVIHEAELLGVLTKYGKWTETTRFREAQKVVGEKITEVGRDTKTPADKVEDRAREALIARGFSEGETEQILNRIKGAKTGEAKSKIIERTIEKIVVTDTVKEFGLDLSDETAELFRPSSFVPKDNVISVWKDGTRELYEVHPEIARTIQALDSESANALISLLSIPAKWLRAGATLTPEFMARNPLRDQFSAFIFSKYGFVPGVDLMRGVFHLLKRDNMYWEWKKGGGDHAMLVSMDRSYMQDKLGDVLQKYPLTHLIKNPIELLRVLSELGEAGTRIGEFSKATKKEGGGKRGTQMGAFASREVTLDFARAGAKTRAVNQLIAFWNAQVQGGDKMVRAFKDNPVGSTVKALASLTIPSIILTLVNRQDERWKEIPQWQKDLFWIVMTENHVYRIPKPFELGIIFGSMPERAVEYMLDKDPEAFDGAIESLARGISPGVIPTFMLPAIENWANKSMFFDRPIVPRDREDLMPEYQYKPYTTETAKALGFILGKLPVVKDVLPTSPAKIENLVRGWTGGLGMYVMNICDASLKAAGIFREDIEKPTKTLADIPMIRAFVVRYPSSNSESIAKFYENYGENRQILKTAKALAEKENKPELAVELIEDATVLTLENHYRSLRNMHSVVDMIYVSDMTGDEKRELVDIVYLQMIQVAQNGNEIFKELQK